MVVLGVELGKEVLAQIAADSHIAWTDRPAANVILIAGADISNYVESAKRLGYRSNFGTQGLMISRGDTMAATDLTPEEKRQRANYLQNTMTVAELYEALGKLIKEGDGDAMIDVDDNFGGSYPLAKFTVPNGTPSLKATVGKMGKWIALGFCPSTTGFPDPGYKI